jgi:hypothetical protein
MELLILQIVVICKIGIAAEFADAVVGAAGAVMAGAMDVIADKTEV